MPTQYSSLITRYSLSVIPTGAAAAQMRGEPVAPFPSDIQLVAGQSIVIRNDDQAMPYFFYEPIAPGESLRKTFSQAGAYGYSGMLSCSLGQVTSLTVTVTDSRG